MDKTLPGREPVVLEQSCAPVADPLEAASYVTDLRDPASEGKDLLDRGRESSLLTALAGAMPNAIQAAPAEALRLSGIPRRDDHSIVVFYLNKKSNLPHIRIQPPGERLNIVDRPATHADTLAYPRHWSAFRYSDEIVQSGT